jgi:two-component sensor histidine kinase
MSPMSASPLNVLLVEDNPGDVRLLKEMLATTSTGSFNLLALTRLDLALKRLAEGGIDIAVLDLGLPDEDGVEIVRRVRRAAPQVPVIVLTGRDDDVAVAEAMAEGVQDYLVKGQIEKRALPRALSYAVERFRLINKLALANTELERRIHEKDILLGEIHHRVKNSLQVVSSLLSLEAGSVKDQAVIDMMKNTQNRIRSMALIHQTLYQSQDFANVDFHSFLLSLVPTLISSYSLHPDEIELEIHVDEVKLSLDCAIPCGLIVNELISNSLKHAFPEGRGGKITITFCKEDDDYVVLSVNDDGIGIPKDFNFENTETLGMQLVYLLAEQIGGTIKVDHHSPTKLDLRFPLNPERRAGTEALSHALVPV